MHHIDKETVAHTARLARIALSEDETEKQREHFSRLLEMVSQLHEAELPDLPPMHHPLDLLQPLRSDEARTAAGTDALMAGAPAESDGLFLVPKVIE